MLERVNQTFLALGIMPLSIDFVINENFLGVQHLLVEEDGLGLEELHVLPDPRDGVGVAALLS